MVLRSVLVCLKGKWQCGLRAQARGCAWGCGRDPKPRAQVAWSTESLESKREVHGWNVMLGGAGPEGGTERAQQEANCPKKPSQGASGRAARMGLFAGGIEKALWKQTF